MKKRSNTNSIAAAVPTEIAAVTSPSVTENQTGAPQAVVTSPISSPEETPPAATENLTDASQGVVISAFPSPEETSHDETALARATEPAASHVKTDDDRQSSSVLTIAASGDPNAGGAQPPALASYRVISPIKLGGRVRPVGAKVELTTAEAADVGSKYIEPVDADRQ